MEKTILVPDPARLIEGLRDTGYTFNTALSDIIDNSVDAGATRIDVQVEMDIDGNVIVSVADNGCGMDRAELLDAMKYGATGKPDPVRLGKFGLGLKTASTAFCRKLSVISRGASGDTTQGVWDIDHVCQEGKWEIGISDAPESQYMNMLDDTADGGTGTVVVWEKVDRLLDDGEDNSADTKKLKGRFTRTVNKFRHHAEMTYHRFLDPKEERARDIFMTLNGEPLVAWDPFVSTEKCSEMILKADKKARFPDGQSASFHLRAWVLPRKDEFSSDEVAKRSEVSRPGCQGFYIYRENRLIQAGGWLGIFSLEPHYNLSRIELSFDHTCDRLFKIDIKKSRILLNEVLCDYLETWLVPARRAADAKFRMDRRKKVNDASKDMHGDSGKIIGAKAPALETYTPGQPKEDGSVDVKNKYGTVNVHIDIEEDDKAQVWVKTVDSLPDGILWAPALVNMQHAVEINTSHPYYSKVYIPNRVSGVTVAGLDSLLWALAEAEMGTINKATKRYFEELRYEVSRLARLLVEDLPEPTLEDFDGKE